MPMRDPPRCRCGRRIHEGAFLKGSCRGCGLLPGDCTCQPINGKWER